MGKLTQRSLLVRAGLNASHAAFQEADTKAEQSMLRCTVIDVMGGADELLTAPLQPHFNKKNEVDDLQY